MPALVKRFDRSFESALMNSAAGKSIRGTVLSMMAATYWHILELLGSVLYR
jgi:hypothetical protein